MIESFLRRMIKAGDLTVQITGGRSYRAGDGTGAPVVVSLTPKGLRRIIAKPGLGVGEAYMDGELTFEQGSMWELLEIVGRSGGRAPKGRGSWLTRARRWVRRQLQQHNNRQASRRNVQHHYDLSNDLYRRFLDADMQYSCAYFSRPDMTLEEAQIAKKAHIADKLAITPGMSVLDIGSGWGGMAMTLARDYGAKVTGVTLSDEQLSLARERVAAAGLEDRVRFELTDYRDLTRTFDRVVSVGMLEHVGQPNFRAYFEAIKRLMPDDGVALIHSIGRMEGPRVTNVFTNKHIFPGGYVPAISEIVRAIEDAGLWITDIEVLRLHYAETLRHWRLRFMADPQIPTLYDARFRNMWEYYLASAEMGFRYSGHMNFQVQLTKRVGSLPMTRAYMFAGQRASTLRMTRKLILIWFGWTLLIVGLPILIQARFQLHRPDTVFPWTIEATATDLHANDPPFGRALAAHVGWDSEYYLSIAQRGYDDPRMRAVGPGARPDDPDVELKADEPTWTTFNYAFFPAYPLAIRAVSQPLALLGLTPTGAAIAAGVLVSLAGALGAILALGALAAGQPGGREDDGLRAGFYLLVWPTAVFLSQVYTEGLFVGLSFGALALLARKRWAWAAALAAVAVWTRATGALLAIPFLWAWLAEGRLKAVLRRPTARELGRLALALTPALAWIAWRLTLGPKFQFVETHYFGRDAFALAQSWRSWQAAWAALCHGGPAVRAYEAVEMFALAAALASCVALARRDPALATYGLAVIAVAATSGDAMGIGRYVLSVPALFLIPARLGRSLAFDRIWTLAGSLVMTVFAITFSFFYWTG